MGKPPVDSFESLVDDTESAVDGFKSPVGAFESFVDSGETLLRGFALSLEPFLEASEVLKDGETLELLFTSSSVAR